MEFFEWLTDIGNRYVAELGFTVNGETIPYMVILLLGTGIFLTLRLGFIQLRRIGHGFAVTSGKYDDPDEPGDVSHFQALTTALSATVGIGNIAGVAIAIHWGGPGALFWMWATAAVGMATKYTEVTLAQKYRNVEETHGHAWEGTVSGGPMYYIEKGLGPRWKWMAVLFAVLLGITAFLTGNAIQANTVADTMRSTFGVPVWVTGLLTSGVVALVILGGIRRIGKVTSVLAPFMAAIYVLGALVILTLNAADVFPALGLIFREAFNPTAGVAGTGVGAFLVTMMWGVRRGLFSNEAGQGSAPIAHAAAKTDEPVSEGVVALLEPFIDTIVICTMTGLVILTTGVWNDRIATEIVLSGGDLSWVAVSGEGRHVAAAAPAELEIAEGHPAAGPGTPEIAWHDVAVERLFEDAGMTVPFTGTIRPAEAVAVAPDGRRLASLWAHAAESGAPLTQEGFRRGLSPFGPWGGTIVVFAVLLFALSTAISWSYYGDRCANYLLGAPAVLPYKMAFVAMHFIGAVLPLTTIWNLGDIFLAMVIVPNLIALILLSPQVLEETRSYFERKPWIENAAKHRAVKEARRRR
ncbi:MAG: sodium:alanine symporter family protein [Gemmatimonadota bacterium]|nr:sodium:alanine symporter family protein [Gemmatimonadota bacterium]